MNPHSEDGYIALVWPSCLNNEQLMDSRHGMLSLKYTSGRQSCVSESDTPRLEVCDPGKRSESL